MRDAVTVLLAISAAYFLGSLPTAYLLVRWRRGQDIRTLGSGNVGASNVKRVLGWPGFAAVFAVDAAKGLLPVWLGASFVGAEWAPWLGVAAAIGHCWPVWLHGHGGKAVSTAFGAVAARLPAIALAGFLVWLVVVRYTRKSSLGALLGVVVTGIAVVRWGSAADVGAFAALAAIIVWRHRGNIARLARGEERAL